MEIEIEFLWRIILWNKIYVQNMFSDKMKFYESQEIGKD